MTIHAIVPLAAEHARDEFDCGRLALNDFLRRYAGQYERRNLGRTFVAIEVGGSRVDGFYTLSSGQVVFEQLTEDLRRKLPRHPVPVVHLGRLAVDRRRRRRSESSSSPEARREPNCFNGQGRRHTPCAVTGVPSVSRFRVRSSAVR